MRNLPIPFDRPFTTADLEGAGVRVATLRGWRERGEVVQIASGVFAAKQLANLQELTAIFSCRDVAIGRRPVSIAGAATLHGLWTPPNLAEALRSDKRRRSIPDDVLERHSGLLVPSPAWTALQLARFQPLEGAVIPIDSALRLGAPLEELRRLARRIEFWPGAHNIQTALSESDPRSESALESWSRLLMVKAGLPRPTLQRSLRIRGRLLRPDFLWQEQHVVGEADGLTKYADMESVASEKRRQGRLQGTGYVVYRWGWAEVMPSAWNWALGLRKLLL